MELVINFEINNPSESLQLSPISINKDYCKKWKIYLKDFVCLTKNGQMLRPTLYRIGGLGTPKLDEYNYFTLIKYVEAFYEDDITSIKENKPHLSSRWCIIDKNGDEKIEFAQFKTPYLVKGSCIYSIEQKYYNIETGEFYCYTSSCMASHDFLFLDNRYDKDESRRGVMKINKITGTWELFK